MLPPSSPEGTPEPNEEVTSSIADDSESILLTTEEDQPPKRHMKEIITTKQEEESAMTDDDVAMTLQKSEVASEFVVEKSDESSEREHTEPAATLVIEKSETHHVAENDVAAVKQSLEKDHLETKTQEIIDSPTAVVMETSVVTMETVANVESEEPINSDHQVSSEKEEDVNVVVAEPQSLDVKETTLQHSTPADTILISDKENVQTNNVEDSKSYPSDKESVKDDSKSSVSEDSQQTISHTEQQDDSNSKSCEIQDSEQHDKENTPHAEQQVDNTIQKEGNGLQQNAQDDGGVVVVIQEENLKEAAPVKDDGVSVAFKENLEEATPAVLIAPTIDNKVIVETLVTKKDSPSQENANSMIDDMQNKSLQEYPLNKEAEMPLVDDWQKKRLQLTPKRQQFISDDQKQLEKDEMKQDRIVLWQLHRDELNPRRDAFFKQDQEQLDSMKEVKDMEATSSMEDQVSLQVNEQRGQERPLTDSMQDSMQDSSQEGVPNEDREHVSQQLDSVKVAVEENEEKPPLVVTASLQEASFSKKETKGDIVAISQEERDTNETQIKQKFEPTQLEQSQDQIVADSNEREDSKVQDPHKVEVEDVNKEMEQEKEDANQEPENLEPEDLDSKQDQNEDLSKPIEKENNKDDTSQDQEQAGPTSTVDKQANKETNLQKNEVDVIEAEDWLVVEMPVAEKSLGAEQDNSVVTTSSVDEEMLKTGGEKVQDEVNVIDGKDNQTPSEMPIDVRIEESTPTPDESSLLSKEQEQSLVPPKSPKEKRVEAINQAFHNITRAIDDAKHQVLVIEQIEEEPATVIIPEESSQTTVNEQEMEDPITVNKDAKLVVFPRQHVERMGTTRDDSDVNDDYKEGAEEQKKRLSSVQEIEVSSEKQDDSPKEKEIVIDLQETTDGVIPSKENKLTEELQKAPEPSESEVLATDDHEDQEKVTNDVEDIVDSCNNENGVEEKEEASKIANVEVQVVKDEDKTEESQSPVIQTENSTLEIITKEEEEKEVHRDQETEISKNKNDEVATANGGVPKGPDTDTVSTSDGDDVQQSKEKEVPESQFVDTTSISDGENIQQSTPDQIAPQASAPITQSAPIAQSTPIVNKTHKSFHKEDDDSRRISEHDPVVLAQLIAFRNEEHDKSILRMEPVPMANDDTLKNDGAQTNEEKLRSEHVPEDTVKKDEEVQEIPGESLAIESTKSKENEEETELTNGNNIVVAGNEEEETEKSAELTNQNGIDNVALEDNRITKEQELTPANTLVVNEVEEAKVNKINDDKSKPLEERRNNESQIINDDIADLQTSKEEIESEVIKKKQLVNVSADGSAVSENEHQKDSNRKGIQKEEQTGPNTDPLSSTKHLKDEPSTTAFDSGIVDETFEQTIVGDELVNQTLQDQLKAFVDLEGEESNHTHVTKMNSTAESQAVNVGVTEEPETINGSVKEHEDDVVTHITEADSTVEAPVGEMYIVNKKQDSDNNKDDPTPLRVASLKSLRETDDSQYAPSPDEANTTTAPLDENTLIATTGDENIPASLNLTTFQSPADGDDTDSELPKDTSYSGSHATSDGEGALDEEDQVPGLPVDTPRQDEGLPIGIAEHTTARQEQVVTIKDASVKASSKHVAVTNDTGIGENQNDDASKQGQTIDSKANDYKPSETSNYSFTGSSAQPSDEEGVINYARVPPDSHPSAHTLTMPRYIDDDVSCTDASFSEAEGVIHYQRLPPDDFKNALEEGAVNAGGDGAKSHIPTSPALLDSQPNKYTIDKKFVSFCFVFFSNYFFSHFFIA